MKKTTVTALIVILLLIPATLFLGTKLSGKGYYLTSTLIAIETMLPFFFLFEQRRPQARELVTLAVMAALSVAGRVAIPLPNFKASTGIIMLTGVAFGPQAGFMTGAVAAFASNFFYSQGPWTPWQMLAYGMAGFLSGAIFHGRKVHPLVLSVFGFVSVIVCIGPLLDCSTLFTTGSRLSWTFAIAVFSAGLAHNIPHAFATAVTLILIGTPLLRKLQRLNTKYGLMQGA